MVRTLKSDALEVSIDPKTLTLSVRDLRTGIVWKMQDSGPGDIGIKSHAGPLESMAFGSAGKARWEGSGNEQRVILSDWPCRSNVWSRSDYAVEIHFRLQGDRLDITVGTKNGRGEVSFIDSCYPRGFLFPGDIDGELVLPYGQGCLLKKNFPCRLDHTLPAYVALGFSMPWWGQLAGSGEGFAAFTDTPDDIGFRVVTEPKLGHTVHPYWQASLGNFRYPRKISYRFFDKADIVTLAKAYREHAETMGLAVTLKEKAKARPNVEKLRGAIVVSIWHMSDFTKFGRSGEQHCMTFEEGLRRFQRLARDAGIEKAIVHVDGWCRGGYDYYHPDVLPPEEQLGGWEGLKKMADAVQAEGHAFLLHDNYVDIYAHTEAFRPENTALDLSGVRHENNEWLGGRQQWLCPVRTMRFAKRNLTQVRDRINPSGTYLDCISCGPLRECYDQSHLCSRGDARKAWSEIFVMCQEFGWATSSEGGGDWAIPILDFCWSVHTALCPFDLKEEIGGPLGTPIPLYSLVWHDCIVVPSHIQESDETGESALWPMLWGGIPSIRTGSLHPDTSKIKRYGEVSEANFVRALKPIMELSEQVAFEEMTNLELLDVEGKVQRTTFSDGTQVTVDFAGNNYETVICGEGDGKTAIQEVSLNPE